MSILSRVTGAATAAATAAYDAAARAWSSATPPASPPAPTPPPGASTVTAAASAGAAGEQAMLAPLAQPAPYEERDPAILGNRLTPGVLTAIIAQRNLGYSQPWVDLGGEFLQKNPHLVSQLAIRRESVVETTFEVKPGKGSNGRGAAKAAKACTELVERLQDRTEASWGDLLAQLTAAVWWQRSCHEVMWQRDGREIVVDHLAAVHPRRLSYAAPYGDPEAHILRIHDPDDPQSPFSGAWGVPLTRFHPDKFLVHQTSPLGLQPTCDGLFAGSVWYLLMYEWTFRDLLDLIALLGRPGHLGYYASGGAKAAGAAASGQRVPQFDGERRLASADEIAHLTRVVRGVSGSLREVLADTTRVEPLRYDQRTTPIQREALEHLERLLSKLINGADSISDLKAGARAAQQVMYAQSFTFWRSDVRRVCSVVSSLFAKYIRANPDLFGASCPTPRLWSPDLDRSRGATTNPTEKDPGNTEGA